MSLFGGFRQLELHSEELDCFRRIRDDQIQGGGTLKNRSECDMKHLSVQISPSFDAPDTFEIAAGYMPVMEFEKEVFRNHIPLRQKRDCEGDQHSADGKFHLLFFPFSRL